MELPLCTYDVQDIECHLTCYMCMYMSCYMDMDMDMDLCMSMPMDMYHERAVEAAGELVESWSHTGSSTCDVHPHKGYATGLYE
jgi:hypothetical protein